MWANKRTREQRTRNRGGIWLLANFVLAASALWSPAQAQILPQERRVTWAPGLPGGLPSRSQACPASAPSVRDFGAVGDGSTDDSAAFQAAIDAANQGDAIRVPQGDYFLGTGLKIDKGIVLCGEGPDRSRLLFDCQQTAIDIVTYHRGTFVDVLDGATKDSTRLTLSDASSFSTGDFAELQQDNDWDVMDPDDHWRNQSQVGWVPDHAVGQMFEIQAVEGNDLIVSPAVHFDYNPAMHPQIRRMGLVTGAGIQGLYMVRNGTGDHATISLKNAAYCWIRDCESDNTWRAHVSAESAFRCEIRHNFFHHAHDYGGGGHGYGVTLGLHVTDFLVEDNIFLHLRHAMMVHIGANGNVFGYNFSIERESDGNWTPCDISLHGHYAHMNLFEGNTVREVDVSDYWGATGPGNTFLRNRVLEEGIEVMDHSNGQNIVGNELGTDDNVISVKDNITDTLVHGNYENGSIAWDPDISDHVIPVSYYYNERPNFFGCTPWPASGADLVPNDTMIPAEQRYRGTPIDCDGGPDSGLDGSVGDGSGPGPDGSASGDGGPNTNDAGAGSHTSNSGCSCRAAGQDARGHGLPIFLVLMAVGLTLVRTRKTPR